MKKFFTQQLSKSIESLSIGFQFCLMLIMLILMAVMSVNSQTITPVRYWTFNGANATTDSTGNYNLNFTTYNSQYTINNNGQVGKFLTLDSNSGLVDGGTLNLSTAVTIEFLFKPGYKFNTTNMLSRGDGAVSVRFEYATITF